MMETLHEDRYIYCSFRLRKGNVLFKIMFDDSNYEQKQDNTPK